MNVESLGAIAPDDEVGPLPNAVVNAQAAQAAVPFADIVRQGLEGVNDQLVAGQSALQGLALGQTGNLHEVMVKLEEGRIALQLMLQVRNRVLEAYQEVMRMQL